MTQEDKSLQTGTPSDDTGDVSPEAETLPEGEEPKPIEQPLTEERILQLIAEQKALGKEEGKREMQGIKDREVAQVLNRAQLAETTLASLDAGLRETDPEGAELRKLRARESFRQRQTAQEYQRQRQEAMSRQLTTSLHEQLSDLGIDPKDERIDWAIDVGNDYFAGRKRFDTSVGKIVKENAKALEQKVNQEAEDKVARERKEAGIDSHDTSASMGVGGSDAEFQRKFGAGELPYSKENVERAKKIMNK